MTRGNNVYGPRQYPEKLIPKFLHLAMAGKNFTIHGTGTQRRSFIHVDDVANAFVTVIHHGAVGETYDIATRNEQSILSVTRDICEVFGLDPEKHISHVENRAFCDDRFWMSSEKLEALGWKEETSWKDGLKATAEWYRENLDHWSGLDRALSAHPGRELAANQPLLIREERE